MNLATTQLKDTYGNLVTTGTTAGSPTTGGLQNGQGTLLTSVGIGTNSTSAKLTLNDAGQQVGIDFKENGTTRAHIEYDGSLPAFKVGSNGSAYLSFRTSNDEKMRIEADGDIAFYDDANSQGLFWDASAGSLGIGTTSPGHPLTVTANPGSADTPVAWLHNSGNATSYDGTVISTVNDGSDVEVLHVRTNNTTYANGTSLMLVRGDGNVGIGTNTPADRLEVKGATAKGALVLSSGDTTIIGNDVIGQINFKDYDADAHAGGDQNDLVNIKAIALHESGGATALDGSTGEGYALSFSTSKRPSPNALFTVSEAMRIDSSGNVGLGVTPSAWFSSERVMQVGLGSAFGGRTNNASETNVYANTLVNSGGSAVYIANGLATRYSQDGGKHLWYTAPSGTAGNAISFTQAMTLDTSGNLLVGKTASGLATTGFQAIKSGQSAFVSDGDRSLILNRKTSDGSILEFRKDESEVGSIGSIASDLYIAESSVGLRFDGENNQILPSSTTASTDNTCNLGASSARFKDLYLGGTSYVEQYSAPSTPTIADDAFYTLTPQETIGFLLLGGRNDSYDNINGLFSYRVTANTYCTLMSRDNTSVETAEVSGAPTITDYTDGKVTVVVSTNGNIYIANRDGGSISVNLILFGQ